MLIYLMQVAQGTWQKYQHEYLVSEELVQALFLSGVWQRNQRRPYARGGGGVP